MRAQTPKTPKQPPSTPTPVKRRNSGWRGLFIDIDTIVGASPASKQTGPWPEPGPDARLDGRVVRAIWLKSGLESRRLPEIWCVLAHRLTEIEAISPVNSLFCVGRNECDPDGTGSPDRDAFACGMVRIDEELRKAQLLSRANAGWNAASAARALQSVPSCPILRGVSRWTHLL